MYKSRNLYGGFDAQITKPELSVLRPKPENLSNRFWDQIKENRVPDLCDHPRSWRTCHLHTMRQANMILLMKQRIKVKLSKCPRFEFKPHQVNDSSQSNQGTDHLISQFDSIHDAHFFCLLSFSFWYDNNFDRRGHKRQVNAILGNLLWLYFPGVVVTGVGRSVPITSWRDYALTPDVRYKNAQGVMRNAFYVSSYIFITSITSYNI
jgi:hypothetical protein